MRQGSVLALLLALLALSTATWAEDHISLPNILKAAEEAQDWIVGVRRQLHAIPELGSHEVKTSAALKEILTGLNITYKDGYFNTGIVATIGQPSSLPAVALRADIDALPVQEPEGLTFRSAHPGKMHACGHDAHMSMVLGAAKILKPMEASLPGQVKLLFQPDEEGGAGGDHMVQEGALDNVAAVFGFHVAPWLPSGKLGVRAGTIMAGALSFHITIQGQGGHAAMPHLNKDPVVAAAACISSLQTVISRETSPLGSAVLSVTLIKAGHAYNVIPDTVEFGGTIRALSHDIMMKLKERVESLSAGIAAAYNCNATVNWRLNEQPYYPPLVNDAATMQFARDVASRVLGPDAVIDTDPIMAGEDFAFYCLKTNCNLGFLGIRNEAAGSVHALHSPEFKMDEAVLHKGAGLHAAWAVSYLQKLAQQQQGQQVARDEL